MRFKDYSKEEAIEILAYLSKEDPFISLRDVKWMKIDQVRGLLAAVAEQLEQELQAEKSDEIESMQEGLSLQAKQILSTLSPREERLLYKSFKLN